MDDLKLIFGSKTHTLSLKIESNTAGRLVWATILLHQSRQSDPAHKRFLYSAAWREVGRRGRLGDKRWGACRIRLTPLHQRACSYEDPVLPKFRFLVISIDH